jgi:hypothetical protein
MEQPFDGIDEVYNQKLGSKRFSISLRLNSGYNIQARD